MFNWLFKRRKKGEIQSLQEAEKGLKSASYPAARPTPKFTEQLKQKLLISRRTNPKPSMETSRPSRGEATELPPRRHVGASSPFFTFRWKIWIPAISAAVIVLLLIPIFLPFLRQEKLFMVPYASAEYAFEATAINSDQSGIEAATRFRIKSKAAVDPEELKKNIRFEPETQFEMKTISDTEFEVTPADPLASGTVYNLVIDAAYRNEKGIVTPKEFRFAFQVKDTFKVMKTLPGDKKDSVPVDTGIEVTFSHPTVTVDDFSRYFSIRPSRGEVRLRPDAVPRQGRPTELLRPEGASLTPDVKGRFEKHAKAFVFVPKNPLQEETLYTVKIAKGLPLKDTDQALPEDYSFEFFTQMKGKQMNESRLRVDFNDYYGMSFQSFGKNEKIVLPIDVWGGLGEIFVSDSVVTDQAEEYEVVIYKINSFEELTKRSEELSKIPEWVCYYCASRNIDIKGLPLALSASLKDSLNQTDGRYFLSLPAMSDKGFYVITVVDKKNNDESITQQLFQISDLKAYAVSSKTKTLIWVRNAKTGKPAGSADISYARSNMKASTNADGIVLFDTPSCKENINNSYPDLVRVKASDSELAIQLTSSCVAKKPSFDLYGRNSIEDYWTMFSADRRIYLPSDTVNFWGFAKKRKNHSPETLKLELKSYEYEDPLVSMDIETSDIGTFQGKFDLKNVTPGFYDIIIKDSKDQVIIRWYSLEVATFQKPLYQMSLDVDKKAVYMGEKVTVTADVKFFDATPAANVELNVYKYPYKDSNNQVKTDKNGQARVEIDTSATQTGYLGADYFVNPLWTNISFESAKAEYGISRSDISFSVFQSDMDVSLTSSSLEKNGSSTAVIKGNVKGIDIDKFSDRGISDYHTGGIKDHPVDISIIQKVEEKIETGENYNPITKKVSKNYRYQQKDIPQKQYELNTDAKGEFSIDYPFENGKHYRIKASTKDSLGRQAFDIYDYYPSARNYYQDSDTDSWFSLKDEKNTDYTKPHNYDIGEEVEISVYKGRKIEKPYNGTSDFIFYQAQNGISEISLTKEPKYKFTFGEKHIPNVHVGAILFDNKNFYASEGYYGGGDVNIVFNKDRKKLDIEVKTDKEKYKPGETAVLDVYTKNADGAAVMSEVNIGIVDEAVFALAESYTNPLETVYKYISDGILSTANTGRSLASQLFGKGGGAEGGGGGGDGGGFRRVFKNTVYFDSVKTDASGHAKVRVQLSDDITTFRITSQGVTGNLDVGFSKTKLVASQPFFADVVMNDVYLSSDKPQIKLRGIGTELKDGDEITYDISVSSLGETGKKVIVKAGEDYWYSLPALTPGDHEIKIRAQSGVLKDAIAKKIHVVDSLLRTPVSETRFVTEGASLADISAPRAKLMFSLDPYGSYYEALQNLQWSYGSRLDSMLASEAARQLLSQYFAEKTEERNNQNLSIYQNSSGGLQLLAYDDADLDLSFKAAMFSEKYLDKAALERYFDAILENQKSNLDQLSEAFSGKAAMGLPVLNELKMFLDYQGKNLNVRQKLVCAFGLAALGDMASATAILDEVISGHEKNDGKALIIEISDDNEDNLEFTALAGAVSAMVSHPKAQNIWETLSNYRSKRTVFDLEQTIMLQSFLKHLPLVQEGALSYTVAGRTENVTLKKSETHSIFASADDLKQISFSNVKGPVSVTVYYDAPMAAASKEFFSNLKVSRTYEVNNKQTSVFGDGDIVTVVLWPDIPGKDLAKGGFEIIDTLPTGLMPLAQLHFDNIYYGKGGGGGNERYINYPTHVEGQRVSFGWYTGWENKEISYLARVVSKGKFTAEPVMIQAISDPSRMNISGAGEIEIR